VEHIVETNLLSKQYGKNMALNKVSIHVRPGEIYGLIGKNGAGKSTLFKILMDLTRKTNGEKEIFGVRSVVELNKIKRNIGFMMTPSFFPYLSARQNLEYFREFKGITDKNEIDRVLKMVGLDQVKKKYKSYSMGMKQRLNIANALMGSPDLILMDEPINGLDPQGMASFRKVVLKLSKEQGITFIVSSHILGELGLMATRFGFIHQGELIEEIDADALKNKTEDQIILKVDNKERAVTILEEKFENIDYLVNEKEEILIKNYVDQIDVIASVLVKSGIRLYKLSSHERSLEEYYLSMVNEGGEENV